MTQEEFLNQHGQYFHTKLLLLHENMVKDEHKPSADTILHFSFNEGEYSISYEELKRRADEETLLFLEANGLELKMGPLGKGEPEIVQSPKKPALD